MTVSPFSALVLFLCRLSLCSAFGALASPALKPSAAEPQAQSERATAHCTTTNASQPWALRTEAIDGCGSNKPLHRVFRSRHDFSAEWRLGGYGTGYHLGVGRLLLKVVERNAHPQPIDKTSSRALAQGRSSSSAGSFLDGSPRGPSDPSIIGSSRAHRRTVPSTPMNRPAAMTALKKSTASRCLASCCLGGVPCSRSWRPRAGERRCELRVHRTKRSARARTQASSRVGRVAEGLYGTRSCIGCKTG